MSRTKNAAEDLLGSRGRIRVLKILSESGDLNVSEVSRRSGLNYTSVERHLTKLLQLGLVKEKRYGRIRIFTILFQTLTIRFEKGGELGIEISTVAQE